MDNKQAYDRIFMERFSVNKSVLEGDLTYNSIPEWDSIGHMTLIAAIEEAFNITMETDDIIGLSSYKKGFEILAKYGVNF